jgi:hypothetical protein
VKVVARFREPSGRLSHARPECNGSVSLGTMLCDDCGLDLLPGLTVRDVYALLYPERRIEDVDAFIQDVLGA